MPDERNSVPCDTRPPTMPGANYANHHHLTIRVCMTNAMQLGERTLTRFERALERRIPAPAASMYSRRWRVK